MNIQTAIQNFLLFFLYLSFANLCGQENDWPTFRHDSERSAVTKMQLPNTLHLNWSRKFVQQNLAWPDDERVQFDKIHHPIVADKQLFVTSNINDCLYAINTETGEINWSYIADAPIRFAPIYNDKKIYFVCDDSYLYCVSSEKGELIWKFRGAPNDKKILVNNRLASVFPARGAPVIEKNKIYFSAGIWPFMGCFVYALDKETGKKIWDNTGSGALFMTQGHDSPAFGGIAPQGYITLKNDVLLIPNGRATPAAFDKNTGELLYFNLKARGAGFYTTASDDYFYFAGNANNLKIGKAIANVANPVLQYDQLLFNGALQVYDLKESIELPQRKPEDKSPLPFPFKQIYKESQKMELQIIAGDKLYCTKNQSILIYDISNFRTNPTLRLANQINVETNVEELIAADQKLFIISDSGLITCYGGNKPEKPQLNQIEKVQPLSEDNSQNISNFLVNTQDVGYAVLYSKQFKPLAEQLVKKSNLNVVLIVSNNKEASEIKNLWSMSSNYGVKASVLINNSESFALPNYFSKLIVADTKDIKLENLAASIENIILAIRPYGGQAFIKSNADIKVLIQKIIKEKKLANINVSEKNEYIHIVRTGAIEDTSDWTHQYGDASNSGISKDMKVKLPLGMLWFGGSSHKNILGKHGHAPNPGVAGGRLISQGPNLLQATDIYTGLTIWEKEWKGLGEPYDNRDHQPGANAIGSNYVTLEDYIYVIYKGKCHKIEAETGKVSATIEMPILTNQTKPATWGYISVAGDYLIGSAEPISAEEKIKPGGFTWNGTTSKAIAVFNRLSGQLIWKQEANFGFRHNAIAVSKDKLFCIDLIPKNISQLFGNNLENGVGKIRAFELSTGKLIWESSEAVFGTWLSYSTNEDILIQGSRPSRDMLKDEPQNRMNAYNGTTGKLIWDFPHSYSGPCMLIGKEVITQNNGFNLLSGLAKERIDPITGSNVTWSFSRFYGCNTAIGSNQLLVFRSAAAGYYDLINESGTGNWGGFRSSCTNNLIIANGIISCPDYTRGCTCSYQNQTSLALIHDPDVEVWTFTSYKWKRQPIKQLGINFGAPGDFIAENGTLWIEAPDIGGPSQEIPIQILPNNFSTFCSHISFMQGKEYRQIGSSGIKGFEKIIIPTGKAKDQSTTYKLIFYFNEPKDLPQGQRILNIEVNNQKVIESLDIISETKSAQKTLRKEIPNIKAAESISIRIYPTESSPLKESIISGIELIAQPVNQ